MNVVIDIELVRPDGTDYQLTVAGHVCMKHGPNVTIDYVVEEGTDNVFDLTVTEDQVMLDAIYSAFLAGEGDRE
tara:strand:- start:1063 stop:1284 length:222 start_codon:yes stop_codon:yes gene_type:complete